MHDPTIRMRTQKPSAWYSKPNPSASRSLKMNHLGETYALVMLEGIDSVFELNLDRPSAFEEVDLVAAPVGIGALPNDAGFFITHVPLSDWSVSTTLPRRKRKSHMASPLQNSSMTTPCPTATATRTKTMLGLQTITLFASLATPAHAGPNSAVTHEINWRN